MDCEIKSLVMCRACMKVDGVLLPMYGDEKLERENLPVKLAELASVTVDENDTLPKLLCAKCAYRTEAFHDFKRQVQISDTKLRSIFQSSNTDDICVKTEVEYNDWKDQDESYLTSKVELHSPEAREILEEKLEPLCESETEEIHVKPFLRSDEFIRNDSLDPADNTIEENIESSPLFTSEITETLTNNDLLNKTQYETKNELEEILKPQEMRYALLYIPSEEQSMLPIENIDEEFKINNEKSICHINFNEIIEESIEEKDSTTKIESITARFSETWKTDDKTDKINENNVSKPEGIPKNITETQRMDSDSDSDYFDDPKDNLLGSINDTIMRIKEIEIKGKGINYQCTLCLQNYETLTGVLIHIVDNHVPSSGPFFCVVCEKDCESNRELRSHVKQHNGRFPYTCFVCGKSYSMKRYLKRHMSCHTDLPRHRCPKCGQRFNLKSELESHFSTHASQSAAPFACSQCPRLFNHKGNYKRHLISHLDPHSRHLPKYPCNFCGKRFVNNRTLATHIRVHTGEKPFKCRVCDRSFSQQGNLLNHEKIHSNPRSYKCDVCGKSFNQRATLRNHNLLHTGEKPYVCNVCGIAFTFSAALRRHMWTHASDKPFGCEICNARFVGKYDIKRHMKIHANRPKIRRKRNNQTMENEDSVVNYENDDERYDETSQEDSRDEIQTITTNSNQVQTIFIEEHLLTEDVTQIVRQNESEKENVDALFHLIQYG